MSENVDTAVERRTELIQALHAGISRRDWHATEVAANALRDFRTAEPVSGHPSIAPGLTAGEWPSWAEVDAFADATKGGTLAEKIIRAAHSGMMRGPQGLKLLYDIRHAMGWSDLHSLDIMAAGIAEMRKSYLWNLIEWAPKDGTHVLVKFDGTSSPPTVAHWFDDPAEPGWYLSVQQNAGPAIHPTHWQRLPAERAS